MTTGQSAATRLFARWAAELGLRGVKFAGCDLPIHAEPQRYREVVQRIKSGAHDRGALITTHKVDLFAACRDLFDEVDDYAELCGETSCLSKHDGRLRARATDPITAGKSLEEFLPKEPCEVLCLGGGGSATAITLYLMRREPRSARPSRITVVNRTQARLDALRAVHAQLNSETQVEYVANSDPCVTDDLLHGLAPNSLVINATGMGKDTPGSPLTDAGVFPSESYVWELNYRGELGFLRQAMAQRNERRLHVHDGWRYFLHGWFTVIEEVFDVKIDEEKFNQLAAISDSERPPGLR
ncbi:MAG: shikimate dehydrogenase [Gemmatimonadaceae bacterium]